MKHNHVLILTTLCLLVGSSLKASAKAGEPATESFAIAAGLVIAPFATWRDLFNPASIDVDHRGRVWVGEALNYRRVTNEKGDRILILEDTDHDGRADRTKVFYQNPDINGVHGVCVLGNQVIVSVSDRIIRLTDTDGDDKADQKELLFKGKVRGPAGQHDHAIHAVMFGPDGRLYFNFGNLNSELRRADGSLVKDIHGLPVNNSRKPYQEGMVIRCELDGSRVEVLGYNFRNNWEVTVDSFGAMWQSDNDAGSSSCRVNFVMENGNYGYNDELTGASFRTKRTNLEKTMQRQMWHQNDPGVVPNLMITGAGAPTGITVYEGDLLPPQFRGQVIHAEPGRNVVWAFPANKAGAGYTAKIVDLARTTKGRFYRPCDISVAPDGSLLIADWFDSIDCCHRTENDSGRLFRVAPPGHVYRVPEYDFSTPEGAAAALKSPNLSARFNAWTALRKMGARALPALTKMASNENSRYRARALWLLGEIDSPENAIARAKTDELDDIRALAIRIARRHDLALAAVADLVADKSALVRREFAISLHRVSGSESAGLWGELARQHEGRDRWYLEALGIGERGNESACFDAWLKVVGDDGWNTPAGRDIIWRSRAPQAAEYLTKLLLSPDLAETERPRLVRALDFQHDEIRQQAVTKILSAGPERHPWTFLEAYQRVDPSALDKRPELMNQVRNAIPHARGTVVFVELVAKLKLRDRCPDLLAMAVEKPGTEPAIRALGQLLAFGEQTMIRKALDTPEQHEAMLQTLGLSDHQQAVALLVKQASDQDRPENQRALAISALGRSRNGSSALVKLVQQKKIPESIHRATLLALTLSPSEGAKRFVPKAQDEGLLKPAAGSGATMGELLAATPNSAKGKTAYQQAGCIACHVVRGEGIQFGPELSDIGSKLDRAQLFAAILDPNQTISLGYEGVVVTMQDGSEFSGYISSENETTLSLGMMGGLQKTLDVDKIASRQRLKLSLMPAGLDAAISAQQLVDLVAWLGELRAEER